MRGGVQQAYLKGQKLADMRVELTAYKCRRVAFKYPYRSSTTLFIFADIRQNVHCIVEKQVTDVEYWQELPVRYTIHRSARVGYSPAYRTLEDYYEHRGSFDVYMEPELQLLTLSLALQEEGLDPSEFVPGEYTTNMYNREAIWSIALAGFGAGLLFPSGVMCGLRSYRQWRAATAGGRRVSRAVACSDDIRA